MLSGQIAITFCFCSHRWALEHSRLTISRLCTQSLGPFQYVRARSIKSMLLICRFLLEVITLRVYHSQPIKLVFNLSKTYITTSNTHKTRITLSTQICTHSSRLHVKSKCYINTQNDAQSYDRDQKEIVHVCKSCKTHKSRVLIKPYLIRCIAIRASKSSEKNWSLSLQTHAVNKRQDIKVAPKCSVSRDDVVSATPAGKVYCN